MMKKYRRFFAALLSCILLLLSVPAHAAEPEPIRIAFLDSGISLNHLDAARIETGENLVFPGRDTDDRIGHGTATAGIVLGSEELGLPSLCPETVVVPLVCYDRYPSGVTAQGVGLPTVTNRNSAKAQRRSGTSFSCAVVSALCAAIWAAEPDLSADQVRERLYSTAKDVGQPGFDTDSGWGIVSTQSGVTEDTPYTESARGADPESLQVAALHKTESI